MPPTEPTKTIRPPARRISGSAAWVTATWPTTLTSSWRRSWSSGSASSGPGTPIPALLTTACSSSSSANALAIDASELTSSTSRRAPDGTWSVSLSTPAKTVMPRSSRCWAVAAPMPVDAPVMRTFMVWSPIG